MFDYLVWPFSVGETLVGIWIALGVIWSIGVIGTYLCDTFIYKSHWSEIFLMIPLGLGIGAPLSPFLLIAFFCTKDDYDIKKIYDGYSWLFSKVDTDYIAVFLPVAAVLALFFI